MPSNDTTVYPVIYILGRNNYDNFGEENYGDNIFFVRENSGEESGMVSLYVGESKQTDVIVIASQSDPTKYDPVSDLSNIPDEYKIKDKLYLMPRLINGEVQYLAFTCDNNGATGRFKMCGIPNNVKFCAYNQKPSVSDAITDFIYIESPETPSDVCSIYVFDGTDYVSLIDPSKLVTLDYIEANYAKKTDVPSGDGTTIIENQSTHILSSGFVTAAGNIISTTANGSANIVSGTDVPLATDITADSTSSGIMRYIGHLPRNGGETRIGVGETGGIAWTNSISQIEFTDLEHVLDSGGNIVSRTDDYLSVLIVRRDTNAQTASDVSTFLPNTASNTLATKIFLMNPDVDISNYSVLHILLYFDGLHMCAIVTGYAES